MNESLDVALPGIRHISSYLPPAQLTNDEVVERFGFNEEFLTQKLGIVSRPVAALEQATSDLCVAAIRKLETEAALDLAMVECLIVVTQSPDFILPGTSSLVHGELGLDHAVAAFDINLGCSGFVYGLSVAQSFMAANGMHNGLLVTAEEYSKLLDPEDRNTIPLFGDGASATWLSAKQALYQPGRFTFGSDGKRYDAVTVRGSGTRIEERKPLAMDGRAIFRFMVTEVPDDIAKCLARNQLHADDIDFWVFHQASAFMLDSLIKKLGIAREKAIIDLRDTGNTTSSSVPIALARNVIGQAAPPDRVLICGFGVGVSWASTVLTAVKETKR